MKKLLLLVCFLILIHFIYYAEAQTQKSEDAELPHANEFDDEMVNDNEMNNLEFHSLSRKPQA